MGTAYERGCLLYRQKRYAMAADEFRKELAAHPNTAAAMSMLGLSLTYSGRQEEGIEHAKAAIEANPQMAFAHHALACAILGQMPAGALLCLFGALSRSGRALRNYRKRAESAMQPAAEAINLSPKDADFLAAMAALKLVTRRPKTALKWADEGLASHPDHPRCANLRAQALSSLGRHKEAKEAAKAALALDPESAAGHSTSGWTFARAYEPERATEHFLQTVRLNPNDQGAHYGIKFGKRSGAWWFIALAAMQFIQLTFGLLLTWAVVVNKHVWLAATPVLLIAALYIWVLPRNLWLIYRDK